jgi:transposase InsO family protein
MRRLFSVIFGAGPLAGFSDARLEKHFAVLDRANPGLMRKTVTFVGIGDGRKFRILTIIDEASRECLALIVARQLKHEDVLAALADLFIAPGPPANIRSDNGSEFIAMQSRNGWGMSA